MKIAPLSEQSNHNEYVSTNDNKRHEINNAKVRDIEDMYVERANESIENPALHESPAETRDDIIHAIEKANEQIRLYDKRLEFSIHDETNKIMIKVVSLKDNTVIREVPSEKVLNMVAHIWEMAGMLVDERR